MITEGIYADQRYPTSLSGRFLSGDPYEASGGASDPGSWNRYPYAGGDPVNFNDPSGRSKCTVTGGDPLNTLATVQCWSYDGNQFDIRSVLVDSYLPPSATEIERIESGAEKIWGYEQDRKMSPAGKVSLARKMVLEALDADAGCTSLFGTSSSRNSGYSPSALLGRSVTPNRWSVSVYTVPLPSTQAVMLPIGFPETILFPSPGGVAAILFNSTNVQFDLDQDIQEVAVTMLHELGHAYNYLPGAGGSPIEYDGLSSDTGIRNQNRIRVGCGNAIANAAKLNGTF